MQLLRRDGVPRRPPWMAIISTLLVCGLLGACGTARLAYNNAPMLTYWWLDGYFDFDAEQAARVRADLQTVHQWHRQQELPGISAELADLKARALQNATTEQTCKLADDVKARASATLERLLPTIAAVAPTLSEAQLQQVEQEYEKRNRKWREKYLEGSAEERLQHRVDMLVDRTESFYGGLRAEQRSWLSQQVAKTDYDGQTQYREMLRRQQDALQVLRQLRSSKATLAQSQLALQGVLERTTVSPDLAYRQYLARLLTQGCATMTELHNSMTPQQRGKLLKSLQAYEDDIRILMANP